MGERSLRRRRVIIEDARRNGHHLRATWHADRRQFVVSTWRDDVCTGSARLAVEDAAELTSLLVDGVTQAVVLDREATSPAATRPGLAGMVDRLRWLVRGTPPARRPTGGGARCGAAVETLRRRSA
ncbi:MAG TPA: hypothetical protein VFZ68_08775 [Acidimicrobiales bacterium]